MIQKIKSIAIFFGGFLALIYLMNPTAGIIEIIPDNIPYIGNLDEGAATVLLIGALRYFGVDIIKLFNRDKISK